MMLGLRNLTATASEIKELKLEELFPTSNQRSVQGNDNSDDDFVNPPTPLLRLSSSHENAPEGNMSLAEMQRKICMFETHHNNLTAEVDSLKTTMTEMRSYFIGLLKPARNFHDGKVAANEDAVVKVADAAVQVAAVDREVAAKHVDVFFYHLRKKVKENFEVLSTDSTFQNRVFTMYDACVKKNNFTINIKQEIAKVMMGDGIRYNTHWALVADVLFLIFIREQKHWLLGRLSFANREVHLYNTLKGDGVKEILVKYLRPFCKLLPYYMKISGFYERHDIDFSSKAYLKKSDADPLGLVLHHDCVKSSSIDSGIYMVSFAEYLADKKLIPQGDLDIGAHKSRLGFLFYSYGMAKQIYGYESEGEDKKGDEKAIKTPTKKRKTRSMK
ncbi:hypothetical protein ACET3Z_020714 [Daucus carota]